MTQLKALEPPPDRKGNTGKRIPVQVQGEKVASAEQRRGNPRTVCQPHPDPPATVLISTGAGMVPRGQQALLGGTLNLIFSLLS